MTQVLTVDPLHPDPALLRRGADVLTTGGLVAFPTETVYGLGANALAEEAVRRIFEAKGRPSRNPVIVHVATPAQARELAADWPEKAERLAAAFWPGPLTLVVRKAECVPAIVTAGGDTVGIRIPAHPVALALLRMAGVPIAAPSANRSTELSPTRAEHVVASLSGRIDLILDGGPCVVGLESTVLDVSRERPRLLRPGMISRAALEAVVGPIDVVSLSAEEFTPLPSPGMLEKHYAPRTPLEIVGHNIVARLDAERHAGRNLVGLAFEKESEGTRAEWLVTMPRDADEYARRLYDVLHELDRRGLDGILVEGPPDEAAWSAIRDRLRRAATFPASFPDEIAPS